MWPFMTGFFHLHNDVHKILLCISTPFLFMQLYHILFIHHLDTWTVSSSGLLCYWEYLCTSFCVSSFYLGTHLRVESSPTLTIWHSDYNLCVRWCLTVVLICVSLKISDVEHFLMCLLAIHTYRPFTEKCIQIVLPFLNWAIYLWNCWLVFFIYF